MLAIAVGAFLIVTTEFAPVALLSDVAATLEVPVSVTGAMTVVPGLTAAAVAPVVAAVPGGVSRRLLIVVGVSAACCANAVVALAPSFTVIVVGRFGAGVALGVFWTVGAATAVRQVGDAASVRAVSLVAIGTTLGIVVGMPLGSFAPAAAQGWRSVFGALAVAAAVIAALLRLVLPPVKGVVGLSAASGQGAFRTPLRSRPAVRWGLVATFLAFTGHFVAQTFIGVLLEHAVAAEHLVTLLLAGFAIAGLIGVTAAPFGLSRRPAATVTLVLIVLCVALGLLALAFAGPTVPAALMVLVLAWGAVWGSVPVSMQSWVFLAAPDEREKVSAAQVIAIQAGIGAGAGLGSLVLAASAARYSTLVSVAALVCALAVVAFVLGCVIRGRPSVSDVGDCPGRAHGTRPLRPHRAGPG